MVFSSLLFVFAFLPLNLLFYTLAPNIKTKNAVMLLFSLIFYAWGEPVYILVMLGMTFVDWALTLLIAKSEGIYRRRRFLLFLIIFINLLMLGIFKYGNFAVSNFTLLTGISFEIPNIALPIGISFYTFQLLTYCIDVYRGEVPAQKNFFTLLLYVSMFHQCIAGPIVRYSDVCAELESRKVTAEDVSDGIMRFCTGLIKKALLANTCAEIVAKLLVSDTAETVILSGRSAVSLWVGVLAFAMQIYFDFSAYSDMAIGMGRMIGIHYNENFDHPYMSSSVSEFWRRWHISLGTFFKDYVYIPLGGSRKGIARTIFNLFIVWGLTGLWHGASWNFLFWGLYFFVFIAIEKLFLSKVLSRLKILSNLYLLVVVFFGWILFKFENVSDIVTVVKGLVGMNGNAVIDFETETVIKSYFIFIIFAVLCCTPIFSKVYEKIKSRAMVKPFVMVIYTAINTLVPVALLVVSIMQLVGGSYNPFLYFRF